MSTISRNKQKLRKTQKNERILKKAVDLTERGGQIREKKSEPIIKLIAQAIPECYLDAKSESTADESNEDDSNDKESNAEDSNVENSYAENSNAENSNVENSNAENSNEENSNEENSNEENSNEENSNTEASNGERSNSINSNSKIVNSTKSMSEDTMNDSKSEVSIESQESGDSQNTDFSSSERNLSDFELVSISNSSDSEASLLEEDSTKEIKSSKANVSLLFPPESPLPDLIIVAEDTPNKHDHPIEFYRKVLKKAQKFYQRYVIEGKKDISDVSTDPSDDDNASPIKPIDLSTPHSPALTAIEASSGPPTKTRRPLRDLNKSAPTRIIPTEAYFRPLSFEASESLPLRPLSISRRSPILVLYRKKQTSREITPDLGIQDFRPLIDREASANREIMEVFYGPLTSKSKSSDISITNRHILKPVAQRKGNDPRKSASNATKEDSSKPFKSKSQNDSMKSNIPRLSSDQMISDPNISTSEANKDSSGPNTTDKEDSTILSKSKEKSSSIAENTKGTTSNRPSEVIPGTSSRSNIDSNSNRDKDSSLSYPDKVSSRPQMTSKHIDFERRDSSRVIPNSEGFEGGESNVLHDVRRNVLQIEGKDDNTTESSETCFRVVSFKADIHKPPIGKNRSQDTEHSRQTNISEICANTSREIVDIMRGTAPHRIISSFGNEPKIGRNKSDDSKKEHDISMERASTEDNSVETKPLEMVAENDDDHNRHSHDSHTSHHGHASNNSKNNLHRDRHTSYTENDFLNENITPNHGDHVSNDDDQISNHNSNHDPTDGYGKEAVKSRKRKLTQSPVFPEAKRIKLQDQSVQTDEDFCVHCAKPRHSIRELLLQSAVDNSRENVHVNTEANQNETNRGSCVISHGKSQSDEAGNLQEGSNDENSRLISVELEEKTENSDANNHDTNSKDDESLCDSESVESISKISISDSNDTQSDNNDLDDDISNGHSKQDSQSKSGIEKTNSLCKSNSRVTYVVASFVETERQSVNDGSNPSDINSQRSNTEVQQKTDTQNENNQNSEKTQNESNRQSDALDVHTGLRPDLEENRPEDRLNTESGEQCHSNVTPAIATEATEEEIGSATATTIDGKILVRSATVSTQDYQLNVRNAALSILDIEHSVEDIIVLTQDRKRNHATVTTQDTEMSTQVNVSTQPITMIISNQSPTQDSQNKTVSAKSRLKRNATVSTQDYQTQVQNETTTSVENIEPNAKRINSKSEQPDQNIINTQDLQNKNANLAETQQIEAQCTQLNTDQDPNAGNTSSTEDIQSNRNAGESTHHVPANAGINQNSNNDPQNTQRTDFNRNSSNAENSNGHSRRNAEENRNTNTGSGENNIFNVKLVGRQILIKNCHCPNCPTSTQMSFSRKRKN